VVALPGHPHYQPRSLPETSNARALKAALAEARR